MTSAARFSARSTKRCAGAIADTRRPNPVNGNGSPPTRDRRWCRTCAERAAGQWVARHWTLASGGNARAEAVIEAMAAPSTPRTALGTPPFADRRKEGGVSRVRAIDPRSRANTPHRDRRHGPSASDLWTLKMSDGAEISAVLFYDFALGEAVVELRCVPPTQRTGSPKSWRMDFALHLKQTVPSQRSRRCLSPSLP